MNDDVAGDFAAHTEVSIADTDGDHAGGAMVVHDDGSGADEDSSLGEVTEEVGRLIEDPFDGEIESRRGIGEGIARFGAE